MKRLMVGIAVLSCVSGVANAAKLTKNEKKLVCETMRSEVPTSRFATGVTLKECLKLKFEVTETKGDARTIELSGPVRDDDSRVLACTAVLEKTVVTSDGCEIY